MNISVGGEGAENFRVLVPVLKYVALIFPLVASSMSAESLYSCIWTVRKPVSCQNVVIWQSSLVVTIRSTTWQK